MPITALNPNKSPNFGKALFLNVIKTMMFVDHRRTCRPFWFCPEDLEYFSDFERVYVLNFVS
jgi:hypothetical protein